MYIRRAQRKQAKIKLALQGPAGSGKTYSAIQLSKGLVGDLSKVCIIETVVLIYMHIWEIIWFCL